MTSSDTQVDLIINKLTRSQYNTLSSQSKIDENQLYFITDDESPEAIISSKLSAYYTKTETNALSTTFRSGLATTSSLTANYYTKAQTNALSTTFRSGLATSANVSTIVSGFGYTKTYVDGTKTDLSTIHISEDDYNQALTAGTIVSNAIYIVSSENENFYGQRLTNIGEPTLSSDAATKNYVDTNVSGFAYTSALTSNYYTKAQTNSLSTTFRSGLAATSALTSYQTQYQLVSSNIQSSSDFDYQTIANFTITEVKPSSSNTLKIYLPEAQNAYARDFIIRLDLTDYLPTISFELTSGENVDYESDDEEWASFEQGVNIVSFTETKRYTSSTNTKFMVSKKYFS